MPAPEERFIKYLMAHITSSDPETAAILENKLSQIWEEFHEEYERVSIDDRVAWMLRYVEGHTVRDVGRLCCCSRTLINRRIRKTHRRILSVVNSEVLNSAW